MKIACLAVTPKWHGGVETAFAATVDGLRTIGHDVTVIGCVYRKYKSEDDFKAKSGWREQALKYVDRVVLVKEHEDLEDALTDYDGVVISDVYFSDKYTPEVLLNSVKIAPWTSGWHTNMARKAMEQFHEENAYSPAWSGAFVSFWESAELVHPYAKWYRTVLPYQVDNSRTIASYSSRTYDFALTTRIDPRKGVVTYISGLEGLVRRLPSRKSFTARLAGTPMDFPGGPYSNTIAVMLEVWGWNIRRESSKLKSNWKAIDSRTGSEIHYTGNYEPSQLDSILSDAKRFVNTTSGVASNSHLEYSTLEALDAGCVTLAKTDWDDYHYHPDDQPIVVDLPEKSYRIVKGARTVYNAGTANAITTVYDEFTDVLEQQLELSPSDNEHNAITSHNRRVIAEAHNPTRAASVYATVLENAKR